MRLIDILAERDDEWMKMAMSFGVDKDKARDLVQDMYLRLETYVDDPERVMYNEDEVNTFYVSQSRSSSSIRLNSSSISVVPPFIS